MDQTYTVRGAEACTEVVCDRSGEPIAEYAGATPVLKYWNYVRPDGVVIGRREGSNRFFYHRDHLGSTRTVLSQNSTPTVVETYDYMPFGEFMAGRITTSGTGTRPKFTGHAFDDETNLHNMQWRRQISRYGVFRTPDPHYFYYLNLSPYVYTTNNPLIFNDPDGRDFYWHKETGAVLWVDSDAENIDRDGDTFVNIGTSFITFDGEVLAIHQQEMKEGKRTVTSIAFEAVSGLPDRHRTFDYSQEKQRVRNRGPIPEGMWQLTGTRQFTTDRTVLPSGGYYDSWGQGFFAKLAPVKAQTYGRSGFEIHPDGGVHGTAGCIGLQCRSPQISKQFYEILEKTLFGIPSNKRPMVNVRYRK